MEIKNPVRVRNTSKSYYPDGVVPGQRDIPLAFSLFPGNANEQTSLKPLE